MEGMGKGGGTGGMKDMGHKSEPIKATSAEKKYYPSVTIRSSEFPEIKGAKAGDMVDMHVKCKIRSMREMENGEVEASMDMMKGKMDMPDHKAEKITKAKNLKELDEESKGMMHTGGD